MGGDMKGGFLKMTFSVVGLVILFAMFPTILTALAALLVSTGVSNFIAFTVIVGIAPTVLILGLTFGAAMLYRSGYKSVSANDAGGLIRMVMGILEIILFVTLFATILSSSYTLFSSANATWIAFGTVMSIMPTVLFLSGIFAGGATAYGGYKARKGRKALA
ncbi:MAG: hypothetical protein IMZ53_16550 [Thermoplasmata archaeon]|nr:hypothetical protein [Thermoplasmata archaeon]